MHHLQVHRVVNVSCERNAFNCDPIFDTRRQRERGRQRLTIADGIDKQSLVDGAQEGESSFFDSVSRGMDQRKGRHCGGFHVRVSARTPLEIADEAD